MRYFNESKTLQLKNGQQLVLRRPKAQDAKAMLAYLNMVGGESDNLLFGAGEMTLTTQQEIAYIDNMNEDENSLMLLGLSCGEIVTIAQISALAAKRIAHNAEVALSVRKPRWRQGIGGAIMAELIGFAQHRDIKNISLGVRADNAKAIGLYKQFGFAKFGTHKDYFNIDGKYYDETLMILHL